MWGSIVLAVALGASVPKPFVHVATVEGITEYRLPNGLRVVLVPDEAAAKITVNLTVLVGSRHEGYGEKGMAHLLEHMLFKGSPKFKDPKGEMGKRGARWNGTTAWDRTNYFETLNASDENLAFAIALEADRLINSFVDKKDLETEMTVVRNEFESTEDSASEQLLLRTLGAAYQWHNYGRSVIGIRSDIEQVPIDNLKAFYKRFYQPDNTLLVVAGRFDETKALTLIAKEFGKIPRPTRALPKSFSAEPIQDGERSVTVRRVGDNPMAIAVWHAPASSDPDFPALMVLQGILGDVPQGRLHKAIVDGNKGAEASCQVFELKEAQPFACTATARPGDDFAALKATMLKLTESGAPVTKEEVERAAMGWGYSYETQLFDPERVGLALSESAAAGDWRLIFVQRDRIKTVTVDDVNRVWKKYLKPQNRTLGEYLPTEKPDRAEVPPTPDVNALVKDFKGGEALSRGEAFEPSVKNIESRAKRVALPNGGKLVLLSKKTRGGTVKASVDLLFGTESSLNGKRAIAEMTGWVMNRGTKKLNYVELTNALQRMRSRITVRPDGQTLHVDLETRRADLPAVLALLKDVLREPAFNANELDIVRSESAVNLEREAADPMSLGPNALERALSPFAPGHLFAVRTFAQSIKEEKAVTLDQVKQFHGAYFGAQNGTFAVVGDFDVAEVEKMLTDAFGNWTAKEPAVVIKDAFVASKPVNTTLPMPDKQNAFAGAGLTFKLSEEDAEWPAMRLGVQALAGTFNSRINHSLREEKGLSYGAGGHLELNPSSDRAVLITQVMYAPQNVGPVEKGLQDELDRWATLTGTEIGDARDELLKINEQRRASDQSLVGLLSKRSQQGRTLEWDAQMESKIRALTPAEVNAAVKKVADSKSAVMIKAGDFKMVSVPK